MSPIGNPQQRHPQVPSPTRSFAARCTSFINNNRTEITTWVQVIKTGFFPKKKLVRWAQVFCCSRHLLDPCFGISGEKRKKNEKQKSNVIGWWVLVAVPALWQQDASSWSPSCGLECFAALMNIRSIVEGSFILLIFNCTLGGVSFKL